MGCLLFKRFSYGRGLPVSTAVRAAASVEAAASACRVAVEPATDRYMRCAAVESATANRSASRISGTVADVAVTVPTVAITVPAITRATPVSRTPVVTAVVPRARSDEDPAGEVAWTVVTVRGASVRVIPVVAVGANRSRANVPRSHAHSYHHTLRTSVRRQRQAGAKYCKDH